MPTGLDPLGWIVIGFIAGAVAGWFVPDHGRMGCLGTTLLGIVGGLLMGWASWKEFQSEGGKFNLGTASSAPPASTAPPAAPPVSSAPPAEPMARPIDEPMSPPAEPTSGSMDEPMRPMGGESNRDDEPPA